MFAIIKTGNKQYRISKDNTIKVEKIEANEGDEIDLDDVLFLEKDDGSVLVGKPNLDNVKIKAKVLKNYKDYDFIMIGFSESDVLNKIIEQIRHITYKSRIYYVSWGDYNYYDEIKKYTLKHDVSFL